MPRDDVPHFFGEAETEVKAIIDMDNWLADQNLVRINIRFDGAASPDDVIISVSNINRNLRFSIIGKSKNNVKHVVICRNGEIEHDPSIDKSGIAGPSNDGYYWVEFLTPISMVYLDNGQYSEQLDTKKAPEQTL